MSANLDLDALQHLADALIEDIVNTPGGMLLAEVLEDFGSTHALAEEFDKTFDSAAQQATRFVGFDETESELQARANDYLAQIDAEYDTQRLKLGVADELREMPGVTAKMMVAFGENGVKTIEDLAGCTTNDLAGWTERKDGEAVRTAGFLDGFEMTREECESLIMHARIKAGWITEADLAHKPTLEGAPEEAPAGGPDIKAKIGQQLRAMHSDVVNQGVPDRFSGMLHRLDQGDEAGAERKKQTSDRE